jgi:hypothetical protein
VATKAAHIAQAFHWQLVFPQIFSDGQSEKNGFDVLLGNPPWERIKLQEEEFFATRSPLVAESQHKAERGQRIELLKQGMLLHTLYPEVEAAQGLMPPNQAEQQLYAEFLSARRSAEASSLYAHDSGRYPLTGVGDVNTYALFAETFLQTTAANGNAGFIVPTGIATDDSTKLYFQHLVESRRLWSYFGFKNERFLFPKPVEHTVTFGLLTVGGSERQAERMEFCWFAYTVSEMLDERRRVMLTPDELIAVNPNTRTAPVFRTAADAELTKKLYRAAPVLIEDGKVEKNPWGIRFMAMIHMSNDSELFYNEAGENRLPLYEAKMIHQFDHRWATFLPLPSGISGSKGDVDSRDCIEAEKNHPNFTVTPRYWIDAAEINQRLADKGWGRGWLMGWRNIARSTDERSFISSVIPCSGVGHSMPLFFVSENPIRASAFLANMAALVFDFVVRQKLGGTNMTFGYYKQFPVIPPDRYTEDDLAYIVPRVLELTYTAHDLKPWAEDLGYDGEPFPWNPDRRAQLRAELDAYYAKLYSLTRDELRYILDPADVMGDDYPSETFRVLKNSEMREFGEYRTARLVLREFDRMALADAAHEPYLSLLVPPPGQPSPPQYSPIGIIRDEDDARLAGLGLAIIRQAGALSRQSLTLVLTAAHTPGATIAPLEQAELDLLAAYRQSHQAMLLPVRLERMQLILRFFEDAGAIRIEQQGAWIAVAPDVPLPAGVIVEQGTEEIAGILLRTARASLERQTADDLGTASQLSTKRA